MIKGETLKIQVTDALATAVEFRFGGPQTRTITGTKSGDDWTGTQSTSAWTAGFYEWQAWATYADASVAVIDRGNFPLEDSLAVGDRRSVAKQNIDAINSMLTGNAAEGVRRYKINNRELERYSVAELLQLLSYWKAELKKEERAEAGRSTLGPRIAVRF
jgi:hypothetical protein